MKKLTVLIFEFITGGGLNKSALPESLAREGLLMLQSLINDLASINNIELKIMLDFRMTGKLPHRLTDIFTIDSSQDWRQEFVKLVKTCDAVWPIAPESEGILHSLCHAVDRSGKRLLVSNSDAVAIAGNKWLTYKYLLKSSIDTVTTERLIDFAWSLGKWMLKPADGVGCEESYLINDHDDFIAITAKLDKDKFIIQPHIEGEKSSLSCLFKQGRGWLVCANLQHFDLIYNHYRLTGITVNFTPDTSKYIGLVNSIAATMPQLWGYVGIDLIETEDKILVLEINPRLTTSYAGINKALGINCANAVLELLTGNPELEPTCNQPVHISLTEKESHVS